MNLAAQKKTDKSLQEDWYANYYPNIVPTPVWTVEDGFDRLGDWYQPELVLPISPESTEMPIDKLVTKKVQAIMDVPDMVSIDTPEGMKQVAMYNIPPRTEPFPTFEGEMYYDPWQMKEIDTRDLLKPKSVKSAKAKTEKAAGKVGKALQKKYAMLKKHTESDKVKHQINQLNEALENKTTELQKLEAIESLAAETHEVPKIKLQEEDLVVVEPSMFACVRSLNHNVLCLPRTTVEVISAVEKPAEKEVIDAAATELYEDLEFLMDDEAFINALAELDELMIE